MTKNIVHVYAVGKSVMHALAMLLLLISAAQAQTTWTGSVDADWNNAANWSNGVPDGNSAAVIANTGVTALIGQGVAASAKSVLVESGATLDIAAEGTLAILASSAYTSPFTFNYTAAINNQGTIHNAGKLITGIASATYGIVNLGNFNNKPGAEIRIDNTSDTGLYNATGIFTNEATIIIGADISVGNHGLWNDATFNNNAGNIQIDRSSLRALMNNADAGKAIAATFNNSAGIVIGSLTGAGETGIENRAAFSNNAGGAIRIDQTSVNGLYHAVGTFVNDGFVAIGTDLAVGNFGLKSEAAFTNNATGEIRINRATRQGFSQGYAPLENSGTITIGDIAFAGVTGFVSSSFLNNEGGKVFVDRTTESAMVLSNSTNHGEITLGASEDIGSFGILFLRSNNTGHIRIDRASQSGIQMAGTNNNSGKITIGGQAGLGKDGITLQGTFNNLPGGDIRIQRTAYIGLNVVYGAFINEADLTIGADGGTGLWGIVSQGSVENKGSIRIDGATNYAIYVFLKGIFSNSGFITIGANSSAGKYGIYNWARFYNLAEGDIRIDRSENAGLMNFEGEFANDGKISIGGVAGVGNYGLVNRGPFRNNAGAELNIDRSSDTGLYSFSIAGFDNAGTITVGANETVGIHGIFNETAFNNMEGGKIRIDRTTLAALRNFDGTFTNAAEITIGAMASVGTYGIRNQADFANNAGGDIQVDHAVQGIFVENKTFTNTGLVTIGQAVAIADLITQQGAGAFANGAGGTLKGNGQIAAAGFAHTGGILSPGYSPGSVVFTGDQDFTNSTLAMEVNGVGTAGVDYDQIVVNGSATLGGTLTLTSTYTPVKNDELTLITATAISGTFSTVTGLTDEWKLIYTASSVKLVYNDPMPVTLVDFTVAQVGPVIKLEWTTTEETNNAGFYIERSRDGRQWTDIGYLKGNGTVATLTAYTFQDTAPFPGINYYRLRQVDLDGTIAHSRVRAAQSKDSGAELIVWVDAVRRAQVQAETSVRRMDAYNLSGNAIACSEGPMLDLSHAPSGIVLVRVWTDDTVVTRKIVLP